MTHLLLELTIRSGDIETEEEVFIKTDQDLSNREDQDRFGDDYARGYYGSTEDDFFEDIHGSKAYWIDGERLIWCSRFRIVSEEDVEILIKYKGSPSTR